ncbi:metallophosphoesterase [Gulosibacter chungangensis]|nr:metallophosphoesterase [Gulosibacter chungangensis]
MIGTVGVAALLATGSLLAPASVAHAQPIIDDPAAPQPGDPNAPVTSSPLSTSTATDGVIARESFDGGALPEGWSIDSNEAEGEYAGWVTTTRSEWSASVDNMRDRFGRSHAEFFVADAGQFGGDFESTLTSAAVDVEGLNQVRLTFDSHYRGTDGQSGVVEASFDGGETTEILRLDSESVENDYDALQMNGNQSLVLDVPTDAESVEFSWTFIGDADGYYWGIDSVAVHQVQNETEGATTNAWVVSDIQGHPHDLESGLNWLAENAADPSALLMVGDIVNTGAPAEWQEIYEVMDNTAQIRPDVTVAAIGNHERYYTGGFGQNHDRFLEFADRDRVWGEYVLEGEGGEVPVIVLGQEFGGPSDVAMSDAQVEFLEERLAFWSDQDKQVIVMSHFPLGNTVSASWLPWYSNHHMMNERLTNVLGNYPNAILFSGHTHYPAEQGDWAMQRRTDDGHPDGFWNINTVAMHVGWDARGENTQDVTEFTTGDVNYGSTIEVYADRSVVKLYDFFTGEQVREITIPNPLTEFDGDVAPAPTPGEDETPSTPDPEPTDETEPADDTDSADDGDSGQDETPGNGTDADATPGTSSDADGAASAGSGSDGAGADGSGSDATGGSSDSTAKESGEQGLAATGATELGLLAVLSVVLLAGGVTIALLRRRLDAHN